MLSDAFSSVIRKGFTPHHEKNTYNGKDRSYRGHSFISLYNTRHTRMVPLEKHIYPDLYGHKQFDGPLYSKK